MRGAAVTLLGGAWLGLFLLDGAMAADPDPDPGDDLESVAGKRLPEIDSSVSKSAPRLTRSPAIGEIDEAALDKVGAEVLGLPLDYVQRTRRGLELVFHRKYREARRHFRELDADHPGTGISGTVDALVWQALMLENFDFRYDKQYVVANKEAVKGLELALKDPAHQAWEHFQLAGLKGIEAIHMVRQGTYMGALNRAFEAMDHIQSARKESPDYTDLGLADGMYNYWRTVVTMSSKMLPSFGDQRAVGLEQLHAVEREGIFLRQPATLALAFSWLEERKFKKAAEACERNRSVYPDNVINNLLTGQSYTFMRRYDDAIAIYEHIRKTAPDNRRVYYFYGLALVRKGDTQQGVEMFEEYLSSEHLEDWQISATSYRLGQAKYRLRDFSGAYASYRAAVKANGNKSAKRAMSRMEDQRREGRISF